MAGGEFNYSGCFKRKSITATNNPTPLPAYRHCEYTGTNAFRLWGGLY
jgi:hypothetical protein